MSVFYLYVRCAFRGLAGLAEPEVLARRRVLPLACLCGQCPDFCREGGNACLGFLLHAVQGMEPMPHDTDDNEHHAGDARPLRPHPDIIGHLVAEVEQDSLDEVLHLCFRFWPMLGYFTGLPCFGIIAARRASRCTSRRSPWHRRLW